MPRVHAGGGNDDGSSGRCVRVVVAAKSGQAGKASNEIRAVGAVI